MDSSRRERIRQYKETPRPMGVGVVRNTATGRVLLLSGVDIPALLNRHRAQLRLGAHRNQPLQDDWRRHGEAAFAFEVLDTLKPPADATGYDPIPDLRELEALWAEKVGADRY